jgi:hypothetical protein
MLDATSPGKCLWNKLENEICPALRIHGDLNVEQEMLVVNLIGTIENQRFKNGMMGKQQRTR